MDKGFIDQNVDRTNRNMLISVIVLIALVLIWDLIYYYLEIILGSFEFVTMGILILFALINTIKLIGRKKNPLKHPIYKGLQMYGDPEQVGEQINMEMTDNKYVNIENLYLSYSWLITKSPFILTVKKVKDLMWIYKKVTTHRTNGIKTGTTYNLCIYNRHTPLAQEIAGKETTVEKMLDLIAEKAPWVILGYSDKLDKLWKENREAFITLVDEKMKECH